MAVELHPATPELYRALAEAGVLDGPFEQYANAVSDHLVKADQVLVEMGEQYFIAYPQLDEAPYSVMIFREGNLIHFRAHVGNDDIITGRRSGALAEVMHGMLTRNLITKGS